MEHDVQAPISLPIWYVIWIMVGLVDHRSLGVEGGDIDTQVLNHVCQPHGHVHRAPYNEVNLSVIIMHQARSSSCISWLERDLCLRLQKQSSLTLPFSIRRIMVYHLRI